MRFRSTLAASAVILGVASCAEFTTFDGLVGPPVDAGETDARAANGADGATIATNDGGTSSGTDGATLPIDGAINGDATTASGMVSFVGATTGQGVSGQATVLSPATAAGELLLAGIVLDDPTVKPSAPGFTQAPSGDLTDNMGGFRLTVFYKIAAQADVGTKLSFSSEPGTELDAIVGAYSGASASPFAGVNASMTPPASVGSSASGALAVGFFGNAGTGACINWGSAAGTTREKLSTELLVDLPISGTSSSAFGPSCLGGGAGGVIMAIASQ